jgi:hypothetical protein
LSGYPGIAGKAFPTREMSQMVHAAIIIREAVAEAQRRFHEIHRHSFARMGPSLADPPQFIIRLERRRFLRRKRLKHRCAITFYVALPSPKGESRK